MWWMMGGIAGSAGFASMLERNAYLFDAYLFAVEAEVEVGQRQAPESESRQSCTCAKACTIVEASLTVRVLAARHPTLPFFICYQRLSLQYEVHSSSVLLSVFLLNASLARHPLAQVTSPRQIKPACSGLHGLSLGRSTALGNAMRCMK